MVTTSKSERTIKTPTRTRKRNQKQKLPEPKTLKRKTKILQPKTSQPKGKITRTKASHQQALTKGRKQKVRQELQLKLTNVTKVCKEKSTNI